MRASGEIDLYTVPEFHRVLQEGIDRAQSALVVDFSDISYLDSAGLSALLKAHALLSNRGSSLRIVIPPNRKTVRRILEITRIDALIPVVDSMEEALEHLEPPMAA